MDLELELMKLYNTLLTIETKGQNTIIMADCLRFVEQLRNSVKESNNEVNDNVE